MEMYKLLVLCIVATTLAFPQARKDHEPSTDVTSSTISDAELNELLDGILGPELNKTSEKPKSDTEHEDAELSELLDGILGSELNKTTEKPKSDTEHEDEDWSKLLDGVLGELGRTTNKPKIMTKRDTEDDQQYLNDLIAKIFNTTPNTKPSTEKKTTTKDVDNGITITENSLEKVLKEIFGPKISSTEKATTTTTTNENSLETALKEIFDPPTKKSSTERTTTNDQDCVLLGKPGVCTPYYLCDAPSHNPGQIDSHLADDGDCASYLQVCCPKDKIIT